MCHRDAPLNCDEFLLPDSNDGEYGSETDDEAWQAIENDPRSAKFAMELMDASLKTGLVIDDDDDDEALQ